MLGIFTSVFLVQKGSKVFQREGRTIFSSKYKDHRLCDLLEAGSFERKESQTSSTSGKSAVGVVLNTLDLLVLWSGFLGLEHDLSGLESL